MHPYLEYIIVQQRAEQLSREAEHQRLIREIRPKTRGPFALRVLRWLGFDSTRSLAEKDAPSMSTPLSCPTRIAGAPVAPKTSTQGRSRQRVRL
jgi:hypothetical protein